MEIKELIEKCNTNNRNAQKQFFELFYQRMFKVAYRYLGNANDAEDVAAIAFCRIFKSLGSFIYLGEASLMHWIKTITINESLRLLANRKAYCFDVDIDDVKNDILTEPDSPIDIEQLYLLIERLPPGYKLVFNLYAIEGYSHNEIAELLSISVSTSKTQLFKARLFLCNELEKIKKYEMGRN